MFKFGKRLIPRSISLKFFKIVFRQPKVKPIDVTGFNSSGLMLWAIRFRKKARLTLILIGLISAIMGVISPIYQRKFIDLLIASNQSNVPIPKLLTIIFLAFISAISYQFLIAVVRFYCTKEALVVHRLVANLIYQKSLKIHPNVREQPSTGALVSLYATDVHALAFVFEDALPSLILSVIPLLVAPLAVGLVFDLSILALPLAVAGGFLLFCGLMSIMQALFFYRAKIHAQQRSGLVNEWLQNIKALRLLGWLDWYEGRIKKIRIVETKNRASMVTNGSTMNSVMQVAPYAVNIAAVYIVVKTKSNNITPGELFTLLWIFGVFLMRPLRTFPWIIVIFLDGLSSSYRISSFLNLPERLQDRSDLPVQLDHSSPCIEIKNLEITGTYGNRLLRINHLTVPTGSLVGVVGEVGSGKSLLIKSLVNEAPVNHFDFKVFGVPITRSNLKNLNAIFSYVPETPFLINGNLRDNLLLGYNSFKSKDEDLKRALELVDFNMLKEGCESELDTEIGERGINLSGGQRQRIMLARAIVDDKPIVLLDDSFSSLDYHTEQTIIDHLILGEWWSKTRIIATQALTILPRCDLIFYMDKGSVIACNTYLKLMETNSGFRGFIERVEKQEEI